MSKKKIENIGLSNREKELIQMLNHPEFTVEYIEDWVKNPPDNVYDDAAIALYKGRVEGFLAAVQQLKQSYIHRQMDEIYTDDCRREDIKDVLEHFEDDGYEDVDFDALIDNEQFLQEAVQNFEHSLSGNEVYWDAYWASASDAVKNTLKKYFINKTVA